MFKWVATTLFVLLAIRPLRPVSLDSTAVFQCHCMRKVDLGKETSLASPPSNPFQGIDKDDLGNKLFGTEQFITGEFEMPVFTAKEKEQEKPRFVDRFGNVWEPVDCSTVPGKGQAGLVKPRDYFQTALKPNHDPSKESDSTRRRHDKGGLAKKGKEDRRNQSPSRHQTGTKRRQKHQNGSKKPSKSGRLSGIQPNKIDLKNGGLRGQITASNLNLKPDRNQRRRDSKSRSSKPGRRRKNRRRPIKIRMDRKQNPFLKVDAIDAPLIPSKRLDADAEGEGTFQNDARLNNEISDIFKKVLKNSTEVAGIDQINDPKVVEKWAGPYKYTPKKLGRQRRRRRPASAEAPSRQDQHDSKSSKRTPKQASHGVESEQSGVTFDHVFNGLGGEKGKEPSRNRKRSRPRGTEKAQRGHGDNPDSLGKAKPRSDQKESNTGSQGLSETKTQTQNSNLDLAGAFGDLMPKSERPSFGDKNSPSQDEKMGGDDDGSTGRKGRTRKRPNFGGIFEGLANKQSTKADEPRIENSKSTLQKSDDNSSSNGLPRIERQPGSGRGRPEGKSEGGKRTGSRFSKPLGFSDSFSKLNSAKEKWQGSGLKGSEGEEGSDGKGGSARLQGGQKRPNFSGPFEKLARKSQGKNRGAAKPSDLRLARHQKEYPDSDRHSNKIPRRSQPENSSGEESSSRQAGLSQKHRSKRSPGGEEESSQSSGRFKDSLEEEVPEEWFNEVFEGENPMEELTEGEAKSMKHLLDKSEAGIDSDDVFGEDNPFEELSESGEKGQRERDPREAESLEEEIEESGSGSRWRRAKKSSPGAGSNGSGRRRGGERSHQARSSQRQSQSTKGFKAKKVKTPEGYSGRTSPGNKQSSSIDFGSIFGGLERKPPRRKGANGPPKEGLHGDQDTSEKKKAKGEVGHSGLELEGGSETGNSVSRPILDQPDESGQKDKRTSSSNGPRKSNRPDFSRIFGSLEPGDPDKVSVALLRQKTRRPDNPSSPTKVGKKRRSPRPSKPLKPTAPHITLQGQSLSDFESKMDSLFAKRLNGSRKFKKYVLGRRGGERTRQGKRGQRNRPEKGQGSRRGRKSPQKRRVRISEFESVFGDDNPFIHLLKTPKRVKGLPKTGMSGLSPRQKRLKFLTQGKKFSRRHGPQKPASLRNGEPDERKAGMSLGSEGSGSGDRSGPSPSEGHSLESSVSKPFDDLVSRTPISKNLKSPKDDAQKVKRIRRKHEADGSDLSSPRKAGPPLSSSPDPQSKHRRRRGGSDRAGTLRGKKFKGKKSSTSSSKWGRMGRQGLGMRVHIDQVPMPDNPFESPKLGEQKRAVLQRQTKKLKSLINSSLEDSAFDINPFETKRDEKYRKKKKTLIGLRKKLGKSLTFNDSKFRYVRPGEVKFKALARQPSVADGSQPADPNGIFSSGLSKEEIASFMRQIKLPSSLQVNDQQVPDVRSEEFLHQIFKSLGELPTNEYPEIHKLGSELYPYDFPKVSMFRLKRTSKLARMHLRLILYQTALAKIKQKYLDLFFNSTSRISQLEGSIERLYDAEVRGLPDGEGNNIEEILELLNSQQKTGRNKIIDFQMKLTGLIAGLKNSFARQAVPAELPSPDSETALLRERLAESQRLLAEKDRRIQRLEEKAYEDSSKMNYLENQLAKMKAKQATKTKQKKEVLKLGRKVRAMGGQLRQCKRAVEGYESDNNALKEELRQSSLKGTSPFHCNKCPEFGTCQDSLKRCKRQLDAYSDLERKSISREQTADPEGSRRAQLVLVGSTRDGEDQSESVSAN